MAARARPASARADSRSSSRPREYAPSKAASPRTCLAVSRTRGATGLLSSKAPRTVCAAPSSVAATLRRSVPLDHGGRERVDDGGERRVLHPAGGGRQRLGQQVPAAAGVPAGLQRDHGEPGLGLRAHRDPPRRVLVPLRHPRQRRLAAAGRRGEVPGPPLHLGGAEHQPLVGVVLGAGRGGALGPPQVGASAVYVAGPRPCHRQRADDVRHVAPGVDFEADLLRLRQRGHRLRVVRAERRELGHLVEAHRDSPRVTDRAELVEGRRAVGLGPVQAARVGGVRGAVHAPGGPHPGVVRRLGVPVDRGDRGVGVTVEHGHQRHSGRGHGMNGLPGVGEPGQALDRGGQRLADLCQVQGRADRHHRARHPRLGHQQRVVRRLQHEDLASQRVAFTPAALRPVEAERPHEAQRGGRVPPRDRPPQRGVDVVLFRGQRAVPGPLLPGAQQRVGGLGEVQVVGGHRVPGRGLLPRFGQPLQAVGAHRLQHPVPRAALSRAVRRAENRLGDQAGERGQHVATGQRATRAHLFRRGQRRAAGEDREAAGEHPFRLRQQVPAPVDDGAQRLVPGQRRAAAAGEQREPVVQAFGELRRGQGAQPRGCQFDGQRHAVQRLADAHHGGHVAVVEREAGQDSGSPVTKQANRRIC